jgi:hypothetical protein
LVFLLNTGEYYLWYLLVQNKVRNEVSKEIKSGLKDKDLFLVVVSEKDKHAIHWIHHGKEFLYKWSMYDVVKITNKNQKTFIYCINDVKEKQLLDNYKVKEKLKKELDKKIKRFFQSNYFSTISVLRNTLNVCDCNFRLIIQHCESNYKTIPSPPPKL